MLSLSEGRKVYAYSEPVDMRKSFQGLIAVTQALLNEDPLSGSVFLFQNRKRNYVKLLVWDRTGYVLYAKRLERGRFKISFSSEKQLLNHRQLSFLLDGIPIGIPGNMG